MKSSSMESKSCRILLWAALILLSVVGKKRKKTPGSFTNQRIDIGAMYGKRYFDEKK